MAVSGKRVRTDKTGRFRISTQFGFNFDEMVVDNFAGGGGASMGMEAGLGRPVDIAINHDPGAVEMHLVNHPLTRHLCESVWDVDPVEVTGGRPVGLAWFSPDCKHFSKAKGKKPVEKQIRGLAWVVLKWIGKVQPRIVMLENVEEFVTWGPLVKDANGDSYPCPKRKGKTFQAFVKAIRKHGYEVEYRELRACDYGAPTSRKRFFLVARCDGEPIVWPEPTHGDPKSESVKSRRLKPWRTAAECIDWSIPCPSIFLSKEEGRRLNVRRPLVDATLRRIARGVMRYVVESPEPFIVSYYGEKKGRGFRGQETKEPLRTQTTENRFALVAPQVVGIDHRGSGDSSVWPGDAPLTTVTTEARHAVASATLIQTGYGERKGQAPRVPGLDKPLGTVVAGGGKHALVSAFLAKHYGGVVGSSVEAPLGTVTSIDHHSLVAANLIRHFGESTGQAVDAPAPTIMADGAGKTGLVAASLVRNFGKSLGAAVATPHQTITSKSKDSLVTSHLVKLRGTCKDGQVVTSPMPTITAGGFHVGEVRAFLIKYYGVDVPPDIRAPLATVTTKDRFGIVTVHGEEYQIADIGMRMLTPRELFNAQGFPSDYIIDRTADGRKITATEQVKRCGNSVPPAFAEALVKANYRTAETSVREAIR
jgi:DNA (cytosine-5)-methyltransferase 1